MQRAECSSTIYTLQETKAPAGYVKDNKSYPVVISAEYNEDGTLKSYSITIDGKDIASYSVTTENKDIKTVTKDDGNMTFPINNKKGAELPSTGGIGTIIFYVLGSILVIGCGIVLVSKRRMGKEK